MTELPAHWMGLPLGKLAANTKSINPSTFPNELFELYSVPSFSVGQPDRVRGSEIKSNKQLVEPGDVLLCKIVPHLNRVWVVSAKKGHRQIGSGEWIVHRSNGCNPHYLRYLLSAPDFRERFLQTVSGVGGSLMRARPALVKQIEVSIAPHAEQRRIVAKLDSLSAHSSRARHELDRIPTLIERYKEAILAKAFSGQLTADWRIANPAIRWSHTDASRIHERRDAYLTGRRGSRLRQLFSAQGCFGTPPSWLSGHLADVVDLLAGFAFKSSWYQRTGVRLLRGANIAPGKLDWSDEARLSTDRAAEFSEYRLVSGDIVIAMDRPLISGGFKVARVPPDDDGVLLVQRVSRLRPTTDLDPGYAWHYVNSDVFVRHAMSTATGSDLPHISANDILSAPIYLPPLPEQVQIANLLSSAFSSLELLGCDHSRAVHLLTKFGQATLAKAFRGELIPQDPNDEPAAKLLERIRAERAEQPQRRGRAGRRKPVGALANHRQ